MTHKEQMIVLEPQWPPDLHEFFYHRCFVEQSQATEAEALAYADKCVEDARRGVSWR